MRTDSAFRAMQKIEQAGMPMAICLFEKATGAKVVPIVGQSFQIKEGDAVAVHLVSGQTNRLEFKIREREYTGDLLFEDWSDKGRTPGWAVSCKADLLATYFMNDEQLIVVRWPATQQWYATNKYRYPEKSPYILQKNHTVFRCVPTGHLREAGLIFYSSVTPTKPNTRRVEEPMFQF